MSIGVFLSATVSLAVLLLIGFFIVSIFWPEGVSRGLKWTFAPAVGAGACSFIFVLARRPMFTVEVLLLVLLAANYFFVEKHGLRFRPWTAPRLPASSVLLALAAGIAVSQWLVVIEREPHGDWDATAIWNSHSRYLYRDGPAWQTDIRNTLHADYPLLVPSLVARLWRYIGTDIPDAASIPGVMFIVAAIAVLVGVLAELRNFRTASIMAVVLLATPFFIHYGVAQSADVPLSLYVLSTVALICLERAWKPDRLGLLALAGFTAGCAAWVKNEGLLFLVVTSGVVLLPAVKAPAAGLRRWTAFVAGALLPLMVILWFKLTIAPSNDIFGNRHSSEMLEKIADPSRHAMILHNFSQTFWTFGDWLLSPALVIVIYVAIFGIDRKMVRNTGWLQGLSICVLTLAGYYVTYLVTPMDLQWHLNSSLPRLYLHLWPTALLLTGLAVKPAPASAALLSQRQTERDAVLGEQL